MSKVLVVEDCKSQREMIVNLVSHHNFDVFSACNGLEAIALANSIFPDVIILDIIMPNMNGYEVCRKLRENPKHRQISILICSTKSTKVDTYWAMKNGANAYITKPYQPEHLITMLNELIKT
jgi:twitching motility two-component system response regulator PilH